MSSSTPVQGRRAAPAASPSSRASLERDVDSLKSGTVTIEKLMTVAQKHGMTAGDLINAFPELLTSLLNDDATAFNESLKSRQEEFQSLITSLKMQLKERMEQFEEKYKEFLDLRRMHPELLSPTQAPAPIKDDQDPLELKDRIPTSFPV